ncbi:MAG: DUF3352 domain-containing protein [Candidatus Gracilibacteria bacterium]
MKNAGLPRQKKLGILLISIGVLVVLFVSFALYKGSYIIVGIPELLPADATVAYIEFPTALDEVISKKIENDIYVNWKSDIEPWAGPSGALAILKNSAKDEMFPFILMEVKNGKGKEAFDFLKGLRNPKSIIKQSAAGAYTIVTTPYISYAFLGEAVAISPAETPLQKLIETQGKSVSHLSADKNFFTVRENLADSYFVYAKPQELPKEVLNKLSDSLTQMPIITNAFPAIGISAQVKGNTFYGKSYAVNPKNLTFSPEQAYKALLLPYLPAEFDVMIAGQNLTGQIEKIESLVADRKSVPQLSAVLGLLAKEYLKTSDDSLRQVFAQGISDIFSKEFALTVNSQKILLATEITGEETSGTVERMRELWKTLAANLTPMERDVTLPDGTFAKELVPDPKQIKETAEDFNGISIHGLAIGKNLNIFDASSQNKWFFSNDIETLKKALTLTQEPGANLRESEQYKTMLRPILKNPELLGVASSAEIDLSFSKRTFADHMETNFVFVLK